ncbi:MAG: WD40 repeat domain-containing protein, partial [FCB group bacterium]|nr:WD40 repeat domain-containing protein [FCB group bacterium]
WDRKVSIYLFDRRTGRLSRRIAGLPNVVKHLAFSRDGRLLVATLGGANGIRVFRVRDGGEVKRDTAYGDSSYGADFDAAGRLVTTSYDGKVRLYDPDLNLAVTVSAPGGQRPHGIGFSPDGRRIVVGYFDSTRVDVLSGEDLRLLFSADSDGTNFDLNAVAWSADGAVLYTAGRYDDGTGMNPIRRWTKAGRGPYRDLPGPRSTVMGLRALADGRLVFGSADPAWGVLNAAGELVHHQRPEIADPSG